MKINIIVLNYNGVDLLRDYMPSIIEASEKSSYNCSVTVLDNKSTDESISFIKKAYPAVKIYVATENKVFCSYNEFISQVDDDVVILLNNDMRLDPGFIDPMIEHFNSCRDVFFVASRGDCSIADYGWGTLRASIGYDGYSKLIEEDGLSLSAGIGAFDRQKLLELGGFDELYLPGIYEDVDLCYRGWKKGYKGIYEPKSRQYHKGQASFGVLYSNDRISSLVFRNGILFMVKNITSPYIFLKFALCLSFRLAYYLLCGRRNMLSGFFESLKYIPKALKSRQIAKKNFLLKDQEIINIVNAKYYELKKSKRFNMFHYAKKQILILSTKNKIAKALYFAIGFFSVRLFFPIEYFVIKELISAKNVLDLGCGRHSPVGILPDTIHKTGVELYEPYLEKAVSSKRHNVYIKGDITNMQFKDKSFDVVVALDVIEHLQKKDAIELINRMEKWASKKVVIFTPNGYMDQGCWEGNPYQQHRSGWTADFFKNMGFKIYGVRGFKGLRRIIPRADGMKWSFLEVLIDTTQVATYFLPEFAYQLFCVKDLT
jgi:N-acetylglucosaminyl-diphospho-decaprenol L-rhamnosyltransferase